MNYIFSVFVPPTLSIGKTNINNDNLLNMSNDEKLVFILKIKSKDVCIYVGKAWDTITEILYK